MHSAPATPFTPKPARLKKVPAAILALLVAVGLGVWGYSAWVRPNISPRNYGVVDPGKLYRSAALTPAAVRLVHRRDGIRTIVDLGGFDKNPAGGRIAQRTAAALGIDRFVFELEGDGTGNPNAYVAALTIINDPARQPVLVHCSSGAQRTSGCVMLYKDLVLGQPLDETYPEASEYRHDPARNPKLLPFVKEYETRIAEALNSGSAIDGFPAMKIEPVTGE